MNRMLDAKGGSKITLQTWSRTSLTQQWFFDSKSRTIKSVQWKDRSIEIDNSGEGTGLQLSTSTARWWQLWSYKSFQWINMKGGIINASEDEEGAEIKIEKTGFKEWSSKFTIYYADKMPPEIKKGDLDPTWGIKHDVTFHIVTKMPTHRYLDMVDGKFVIKTPNGFKTQSWYFDSKTKTIRSSSNDKSWDIVGNGKSKEIRVYSSSSKWW